MTLSDVKNIIFYIFALKTLKFDLKKCELLKIFAILVSCSLVPLDELDILLEVACVIKLKNTAF